MRRDEAQQQSDGRGCEGFFHVEQVKAGARLVVGGVGFLENVFHVGQRFV